MKTTINILLSILISVCLTWAVMLAASAAPAELDQADVQVGTKQVPNTELIADVLLDKLTYPSTVRAGHPRQVWHCRKAVDGCAARLEAFEGYFVAAVADKTYATDAWLLAAMAFKETGMNPYATGAANEMGLLQIHPKNKHARGLKFHRSEKYREQCRTKVGACQAEVVTAAASVLEASIEACDGSIELGLGMYNTGRCTRDVFYVTKVLAIRSELIGRAVEASADGDAGDGEEPDGGTKTET